MRRSKRGTEPTFEELKSIEKRRRAILRRNELPFLKILSFWDGTCLQFLCLDPLLWITVAIYVAIRVQARNELPKYVSNLNTGKIGVLGSFLSFFLVYYVVSSNKRFDDQYNLCMTAKGRILDIASMARATLPRDKGLRLVRYMNASHVVAYVGISDWYNLTNFFNEINKSARLLTESERERIQSLDMDAGGSCYRELVAWCQMEIQAAHKNEIIDSMLASQFREKLLGFQVALSGLYNYTDEPVPFFYVHFICLLSALYLPLFAVTSAFEAGTGSDVYWTADLISGLIVFLQAIFVIGLRLLGQKMTDPFGCDLEDLSVMHYINFTWQQSNRIIAAKFPTNTESRSEAEIEEDIVRERATIGAAWDDRNKKLDSCDDSESTISLIVKVQHTDSSVLNEPEPPVPSEVGWSNCAIQ